MSPALQQRIRWLSVAFCLAFHSPGGATGQQESPSSSSAILELRYPFEEEQPVGTAVGNVVRDANLARIYDPAALRQLTFRFLKQQPNNEFFVDNVTGVIRSASRIDREALCADPAASSCDIRIDVAVQPLQYFRIVRVTVSIVDVNDNTPRFPEAEFGRPLVIEVLESAAVGSTLPVPEALDADGPEFGVQSYALVADTDAFMLTSGERRRPDGTLDVRLVLTKPLDRELVDRYRMQIVAVDGGVPPRTGSVDVDVVVVDVNDNSPIFDQDSYEASLPENVQAQTTFVRVHAVDYDVGLNGELVYSLSAQSAAAYGSVFGVDNATGDVFVKGPIDYEDSPVYRLTIVARDRGTGTDPVPVPLVVNVVDVNDNPPSIAVDTLSSTPGVAEIYEGAAVGSFVAHLSVVDRDSGSNGRFSCRLTAESVDDERRFVLSPMVGADGEFQIATAAELDREVTPAHELTVVCRDFGPAPALTSTARVVVSVLDANDNDPVFVQTSYVGELIENNYVGAVVLQVNATDRDQGPNGRITYSVDGDAGAWFDVDPATGLLTAGVSFDREATEIVRFSVVARDGGDPARSTSVPVVVSVVDVNDERPAFSQPAYSFSVAENRPAGTSVGSVAAFDPDGSIYGEVTYALVQASASTHPASVSGSDAFEIDQRSGRLTTTRTLDREQTPVLHVVVVASDRGVPPLTSTSSVTVYVGDENDNRPAFVFPTPSNCSVQVSAAAPVGHVVARLLATDADDGKNGQVLFYVSDETRTDYFDVDADLGVVIVNRGLADVDGRQFDLEVVARDQGQPHHSVVGALQLVVNRSLAFVADADVAGSPGSPTEGAFGRGFRALFGNQNLLIVVVLAGVSAIIALALIIAIVVIRRQERDGKATNKYNCRTEALKMLSATSASKNGCVDAELGGIVVRRGSDDSSDGPEVGSLLRPGAPQVSRSSSDDRSKQGLCVDDASQCCCKEQCLERSEQSWPSTIDNQLLQNPQACSSLLTDTSSAVNGSSGSRRQGQGRSNVVKSAASDCRSPSSRCPLVQSRESEVCRLLKALQHDDTEDSDHSGDGSNTDSGRGPSEEGENTTRAKSAISGDQRIPDSCRQRGDDDTASGNQVVPDNSYASSHSYSNSHVPGHMTTFSAACNGRSPTPTLQSSRLNALYGDISRSQNDVANASNFGGPSSSANRSFISPNCSRTATLPAQSSADRKLQQQQMPARFATYASNACVDDPRYRSLGGRAAPGGHPSPSSPLTSRRPMAAAAATAGNQLPPVGVRLPPSVGGFRGNGYLGNGVRLLGRADDASNDTSVLSSSDSTAAQYSCADVSAALRDSVLSTPPPPPAPSSATGSRQNGCVTSDAVNPRQLCDEIDELFFKS